MKKKKDGDPVVWEKDAINAAAQAVEDFFVANRVTLRTSMNQATGVGGHKFTAEEARKLIALVMGVRYNKDIRNKDGDGSGRASGGQPKRGKQ